MTNARLIYESFLAGNTIRRLAQNHGLTRKQVENIIRREL